MKGNVNKRIRDSDKKILPVIEDKVQEYIGLWKQDRLSFIRRTSPYLTAAYLGDIYGKTCRLGGHTDTMEAYVDGLIKMLDLSADYRLSLEMSDILYGIIAAVVLRMLLYLRQMDQKKSRKGEEYGSATFGNAKDIWDFIDHENRYNNLILSATESLSLSPRMKDPSLNRNKNVLVIGGSGSGKTRGFVKPNLMQLKGSYVNTDPKGLVC